MSESHQHVDLHVLRQVELLLSRGDNEPDAAPEDDPGPPELVLVPPLEPSVSAPSTTHPAAHVPEQPLIANSPVTPLPRRR
jgi:hypothetical protein